MSLLQKYLLKRFFATFFGTMFFLLFLFVLVRTMEMIDVFLREADNLSAGKLAMYYLLEMPYTLNYLFPIGVLFSVVFTLGKMNSDRELTILYTSGKSIFYYMTPIFIIVGLTCTLFAYKDYEIYYKSHQLHMEIHRSFSDSSFFDMENKTQNGVVQFGTDQKIYIISSFSPREKRLGDTKVIYFNDSNTITNIVNFDEAQYISNTTWKAKEVEYRAFDTDEPVQRYYRQNGEVAMNLGDEPKLFSPTPHDPVHLSRSQVETEAKRVEISGGDTLKWWTEYHLKTSSPFTALVMVFLGVSLSTFSRRSVLVLTFFWVLLISFLYMVAINVGVSLGYSGTLPPVIAGWFGNILFLLIGIYLYQKLQN